jgi:hypothetical protein
VTDPAEARRRAVEQSELPGRLFTYPKARKARERVQALHLAGLDVERALEHLRSGRQDLATEMVESAVRRLREIGILNGGTS